MRKKRILKKTDQRFTVELIIEYWLKQPLKLDLEATRRLLYYERRLRRENRY